MTKEVMTETPIKALFELSLEDLFEYAASIRREVSVLQDSIEKFTEDQRQKVEASNNERIRSRTKTSSFGAAFRGAMKLKYQEAVTLFSKSPKKSLTMLFENHLLQEQPDEIARFLIEEPTLSKKAIGEYLGEPGERELAVLSAFVKQFNFGGLEFDFALRRFLGAFCLPGEAQKIDRMMEAFSGVYVSCNPDVFDTNDTAYVLAFSLIMLNTDQHNPSVKNKMTKAGFIKNNRGIGKDGADVDRKYLEALFDSIAKQPFDFPSEDEYDPSMLTFFNPEKEGWMVKQGGRRKNWKTRWFVVAGNVLYYFKTREAKDPLGIVPLEELAVRPHDAKKFGFEIYHPGGLSVKAAKVVSKGLEMGHHKSYVFAATDENDRNRWMEALEHNTTTNPLYLLLHEKKEDIQKHEAK